MSVRGAAALLGLLFVALGGSGLATFGFRDAFVAEAGQQVLLFGVSPILNVLHIVAGTALVVGAGVGAVPARRVLAAVSAGSIVLALAGFVLVGNDRFNILGLNAVDVLSYLVVAFLSFLLLGATRSALRT